MTTTIYGTCIANFISISTKSAYAGRAFLLVYFLNFINIPNLHYQISTLDTVLLNSNCYPEGVLGYSYVGEGLQRHEK